jgi:hypothetical protein
MSIRHSSTEVLGKLRERILAEDNIGFQVWGQPGFLRVGLLCSPLALIYEQTPSGDMFVYLQCSASRTFNGDRTDLHDVFSWVAASLLRQAGACSSALIDIEHPATMIPGELYGRYLIPDQGSGHLFSPDDIGLAAAAKYFDHLAMLEIFAHTRTSIWHPDPAVMMQDHYDPERHTDKQWASSIAELLQEKASPGEDLFFQRDSTNWFYYRTYTGGIAVVESAEVAGILQEIGADPVEEVAGINGFLYTGKNFDQYVPHDALEVADRVLGQDGILADSSCPATQAAVIPFEDGVVVSKSNRAILLRRDTGASGFTRERSLVLERNRLEQERLFPPSGFEWAEDIDGGRFERLIYDLLECEPGVREVRALGGSREGDGGRDLVASWVTPPTPGTAIPEGDTPARERRVIIQCKARKRSVGRSDLGGGVLDTLYMYRGEGYFLAVSSHPAVATIDLLEEVGRRGDYFTGWWGRTEIEQRLRRNPQILRRYDDIVRPTT